VEAPKIEKKKPAKNMLFDPSGLKSSSLFKKIAAVNKSASDTEEPKVNEEADKENTEKKTSQTVEKTAELKITIKQPVFFADPFSLPSTVQPSKNIIKNTEGDDLFEEIEVDKAFIENSFKSAQKVIIFQN
jgi:hypothetical protein